MSPCVGGISLSVLSVGWNHLAYFAYCHLAWAECHLEYFTRNDFMREVRWDWQEVMSHQRKVFHSLIFVFWFTHDTSERFFLTGASKFEDFQRMSKSRCRPYQFGTCHSWKWRSCSGRNYSTFCVSKGGLVLLLHHVWQSVLGRKTLWAGL